MAKPDKAFRYDRFVEAARELGCDESEEAFAEKVRKVAKAPAAVSRGEDSSKCIKKISGS